MKAAILLTVLTIAMIMGAIAQNSTITLTFTADSSGQHVPLDAILIENLTQGGDTILYPPDTVLVLDDITGIEEAGNFNGNGISLSQNYPNPMEDQTKIGLNLPESGHVLVTVSDILGRELMQHEYRLDKGMHSFTFLPGRESLYFFTVRANGQSQKIKMLNSPGDAVSRNVCKLEYEGSNSGSVRYKVEALMNNFLFSLGDQLQYTAYSALGVLSIIDTPISNQTYAFQFGSGGIPCPGMPTVTDVDGNVYNTVLIGVQCWMKENLKTTTYSNGTSIPNVTDANAWSSLTTGAYAWHSNNITWKDKYGALYNWYATADENGLCPTGWHVPTNDEWTALTDYIGGTNEPHGNELKSCRQVNSPFGGDCETSIHPRWDPGDSNYGTDDYGFSGLPGGAREYDGNFSALGSAVFWWSSTEYSSFNAWYRGVGIDAGYVIVSGEGNMLFGFSVRCLRDD
jgi:uncharacterized protein (TIGR02145 family)